MITLENGVFYSDAKLPNWRTDGRRFYTEDAAKVIPFIDELSPELKELFEAETSDVAASFAEKPSDGFTVPLPKGVELFDFQLASIEYMTKRTNVLLAEEPGMGKALPVTEPVLTPNGFVEIGKLKVGDEVFDGKGKVCKVTGVFPQGKLPVFKVIFGDETWALCSDDHLWVCRDPFNDPFKHGKDFWRVRTLSEIRELKNKSEFPMCGAIEYSTKDYEVDPYFLGCFLGDGCSRDAIITLSLEEDRLVDGIYATRPHYIEPRVCKKYGVTRVHLHAAERKNTHPLRDFLKSKGINVKGHEKYIPEEYLRGDTEQRLAILRGLMDTDGTIKTTGYGGTSCIFTTRSEGLAVGVQELVRSLGGRSNIRRHERESGTDISVTVNLGKTNPFLNTIKADKFKEQRPARKHLKSIEPAGEAECVCISVSSSERTFITRDYVVTHNTAMMIGLANLLKPKKILILCPAVAKYNWLLREWPKFSTLKLSIDVAESQYWPDTDVVIINYDILHKWKKELQAGDWDLLFVDESHRIKNEDSRRTIMVLGGKTTVKKALVEQYCAEKTSRERTYKIPAIPFDMKRVFATATPMNRPKDLWTMIRACDPQGLGKNKRDFDKRYCDGFNSIYGWNNSGANNLDELGALMRDKFMVRHDPDKVLDLPEIRDEFFILPPVKIILEEEDSFINDNIDALLNLSRESGIIKEEDEEDKDYYFRVLADALYENVRLIGKPEYAAMFTKFAEIRKKTGIAKVPSIIEFIDMVSDDLAKPIVVFGYHRDVMQALKEHYPHAAMIVGGMSAKAKSDQVDRFQHGGTNLFLGNLDAAGEAITLTRASILAFAEMDWRGATMLQARKRIHRIGQKDNCAVYYLAAAKSFDSTLSHTAMYKIKNIKETLDDVG